MAFGDVTIGEVMNLLNGETRDGGLTYTVFGGVISSGAAQAQMDVAEDWLGEMLDDSAKVDKVALSNSALRAISSYRILMITTGQMLSRGFSYSIGKLSVDKSRFPQLMENTIKSYHQGALELIRLLLPMGETVDQDDLAFVNPILDSGTGLPTVGFDVEWRQG